MKIIFGRCIIGVMIFYAAYINWTLRTNMGINIHHMINQKLNSTPYCLQIRVEKSEILEEALQNELETEEFKRKNKRKCGGNNKDACSLEKVTQELPAPLPNFGPRYDWDNTLQIHILDMYFYGYLLGSLPSGPTAEYFGPHKVIFSIEILSSIINGLCVPAAWGHYALLMVCRFCIGILSSFVYPALFALMSSWAPPAEKGRFVSCLMGNAVSGIISWNFIGLITSSFNWDWGFYYISIETAVFCLVWWFLVADSPDKHRFTTEEEVLYITTAQEGLVLNTARRAPFLKILASGPFWMLLILHFGSMWGLYLQINSVPKFMADVLGIKLREAGIISTLPYCSRLIFGIGFGFLGDFLKSKYSRNVIVKSFVVISHIIPGGLLMSVCLFGCNWFPIVILLVICMALNSAVVITNLQVAHDLSPNFAATIFGLISAAGVIPGFVVPDIREALIAKRNGVKEWSWNFIIGGSMYIGCGIIFMIFGSVEEQSWNRTTE